MHQTLFDSITGKAKEFSMRLELMFFSYRICTTFIGKFPMGYDPINQTSFMEKFPIGSNPPKFLYYSFESKEPIECKCIGFFKGKIKMRFELVLRFLWNRYRGIGMDSLGIGRGQSYEPKGFHRKSSYGLESSKIPMKFLQSKEAFM